VRVAAEAAADAAADAARAAARAASLAALLAAARARRATNDQNLIRSIMKLDQKSKKSVEAAAEAAAGGSGGGSGGGSEGGSDGGGGGGGFKGSDGEGSRDGAENLASLSLGEAVATVTDGNDADDKRPKQNNWDTISRHPKRCVPSITKLSKVKRRNTGVSGTGIGAAAKPRATSLHGRVAPSHWPEGFAASALFFLPFVSCF
jgi:hypothetical protein